MKEEYPLKTSGGKVLFPIAFTSENVDNSYPLYISLLFGAGYLFGFLILFDTLRRLGRKRNQTEIHPHRLPLRSALHHELLQMAEAFYESELFNSKYYASGYLLNSLGDLLLSTATVGIADCLSVFMAHQRRWSRTKFPCKNKNHSSLLPHLFLFSTHQLCTEWTHHQLPDIFRHQQYLPAHCLYRNRNARDRTATR
jgi:hypothetical protein